MLDDYEFITTRRKVNNLCRAADLGTLETFKYEFLYSMESLIGVSMFLFC